MHRAGHGDGNLAAFWRGTQRRHITDREIAPPGQGGGQSTAYLGRAQLQQAMPGVYCEGCGETIMQCCRKRRRIGIRCQAQMALRRQERRDNQRLGCGILQPSRMASCFIQSASGDM